MVEFVPTICPYCGCGCGMLLVVKSGRLVGIEPWARHPISRGRLCIKGWNAHQFVHSGDRLTRPLIRRNGKFIESDWDEALELIASRLSKIRKQSGSDAIAMLSSARCTNEENYLMQKFARVVIGTNNVDHCARLCHASTVAGLAAAFGSGAMTNSIPDIEQSKCIFLIGSNPTEQHPLVASRIVRAVEHGAKLIVADPREIQLAHIADIHLQQRPGSDVALLNGMIKVIIDEDLIDREFIERRTVGFDALREVVKDYDPERVSEITGVDAGEIYRAALLYASSPASTIIYAMGITQHTTGTDNVLSIANLAMLTGNIGRPGTGVNPLRGQNNVQGACDLAALPNVLPGYQKVSDESARRKVAEVWGVGDLPSEVGLTVVEMMNAAAEGKLKALYIMGENPMLSDPDINHVREALERLDFLVVQDIFMTETAELADVVLPSACWAEKGGTFTATDRRVQLIRPAIEPPGEARPDWRIICDLARAMGEGEKFDFSSPEQIFEELRRVNPLYAGMTYSRLSNPDGLQWPCASESEAGTPILHAAQFRTKDTNGLGKFHPVPYKEPAEKADEQFPLILTTGRVGFQWHTRTMTGRSPDLDAEAPEGYVEVNPEDAMALGIADGDTVEVSSRRGAVRTIARVSDRVNRGVIFMPFHFAKSAANVLTNPALDPVAKIPEYKVCAARLQRVC